MPSHKDQEPPQPKKKSFLRRLSLSASSASKAKASAAPLSAGAQRHDVPPIAARFTQSAHGRPGGTTSGTNGGASANGYGHQPGKGMALTSVPEVPQYVPPPGLANGRYHADRQGAGRAVQNGMGGVPGHNGRPPESEYGASYAVKSGQPVPTSHANGTTGGAPAARGGSVGPSSRSSALPNGAGVPIPAAPRRSGSTPPVSVPTKELDRMAIRQAIQPVTPPSSPPRNRGPIHPALASPPGGQPRQTSATPYDMQVLGRDARIVGSNSAGSLDGHGQSGMTRGSSGQSLAQQAANVDNRREQGQGSVQGHGNANARNPINPALAAPHSVGGAAKPGLGIQIPNGTGPAASRGNNTGPMQRSGSRVSPPRQNAQSPRSPHSPASPSRLRQTSGPIPGAAAAHHPGQPVSTTRAYPSPLADRPGQGQGQGQGQGPSPTKPLLRSPVPIPAPGTIPTPAIIRQTSSFISASSGGGPTSPTYINSPVRQMDESPFHPKALNAIGAAERRMAPAAVPVARAGTGPASVGMEPGQAQGQGDDRGRTSGPVNGGSAPSAAMNARSLSSSLTPVRRQSTDFKPPPPPLPPSSAPPVRPRVEANANPAMSEATKYALAIAGPKASSPPQRRVSRPLPQVPAGGTPSGTTAGTSIQVNGIPQSSSSNSLTRSLPSFDFPKSPTLPDLVDPRKLALMQKMKRPRPNRLTFAYIVSIGRIQRNLLPYLGINSFLALLGTSDRVRKAFTGEMVGKWVLREWGVKLEGSKGKSWPNLTVWEGFLESQLHDPSTYATYPAQWHKLLQHLCLSYSLIVLYLRALPSSSFPQIDEDDDRPVSRADIPMRNDRLVEIVMPSPLSGVGSSTSTSSIAPLSSTLTRSPTKLKSSPPSVISATLPRRRGVTGPPISYPTPKRYNFSSNGSIRTRRSSDSRPGSVFSYQSTPSIAPSVPRHRLIRDSVASDPGQIMNTRKFGSPAPKRIEPVFDKPPPYLVGKAAVLRVFVPLSEKVPRWPSAEGAYWVVKEMEKCGAMRKLRLGDLIANTAIKQPRTTEHILVYIPGVKHLLVPLEYLKSPAGHLPTYIDGLSLPPLYHYPLLQPIIIFPNLARFAPLAMASVRLAYDHKDVLVSTGRASAKRCIHVTGFEVPQDAYEQGVAREWNIITLEAEGTGEGRAELERRLGYGDPARVGREAWEVVREKSIGTVWLRAV